MERANVDEFEDHKLVHEYLQHRGEAAFRALYRRHTDAIYAVVLRMLGNVADAEDVVQETWVRAAGNLSTFRWESKLRTWLVGIAINCARNKRSSRREHVSTDLAEVAELPAPAPVERPIDVVDMSRAVAQLPDGYREVLVLHDVYGYTHEEIAGMLGVEVGTSKSQLSRARSALRRWLSESGEAHHERRTE